MANVKKYLAKLFFGDVIEAAVGAEHAADMTALSTALPTARAQIKKVAVNAVKTVKTGQATIAKGQALVATGTADLFAAQQLDCDITLAPKSVK